MNPKQFYIKGRKAVAVQWLGDNRQIVQDFVGQVDRQDGGWFSGVTFMRYGGMGEVYVTKSSSWEMLQINDWIVRTSSGIDIVPDAKFSKTFVSVPDDLIMQGLDEDASIGHILDVVKFGLQMTVDEASTNNIMTRLRQEMRPRDGYKDRKHSDPPKPTPPKEKYDA